MTESRSPRTADEDRNELLADFDEIFSGSGSEGQRPAEGGKPPGQDASEELDDLEALFDAYSDSKDEAAAGETSGQGDDAQSESSVSAFEAVSSSTAGDPGPGGSVPQSEASDSGDKEVRSDFATELSADSRNTDLGEDPVEPSPLENDAPASFDFSTAGVEPQIFGARSSASEDAAGSDAPVSTDSLAEPAGAAPPVTALAPEVTDEAFDGEDSPSPFDFGSAGALAEHDIVEDVVLSAEQESEIIPSAFGTEPGSAEEVPPPGDGEPGEAAADVSGPVDEGTDEASPSPESESGEDASTAGADGLQVTGDGAQSPSEGSTAERKDEDAAEELFPFVPAGTSTDDPPPRALAEPAPAAQAEAGDDKRDGYWKLAFVAAGVVFMLAAGAGLLAWEAQSGVALLNERLASLQAGQPAAPVAPTEIEGRITALSDRIDALAASTPEQGQEIAALRAELDSVSRRLAGLDARLEAFRARVMPPQTTGGTPTGSGRWAVNLASFADEATARSELERISSTGVEAEVASAPSEGRTWYRIRVPGFQSLSEAKEYAQSEAARAGFGQAWVGPQ